MLNNLKTKVKDRLKSGDMKFLKEVLEQELEEKRTLLVSCREDQFKLEQGRAQCLTEIIKLLP